MKDDRRQRCDCCGQPKVIAQTLAAAGRTWRWCALCAEKLEHARGLVLDDDERTKIKPLARRGAQRR